MMITCVEDYDISYNLFLAEQDMFFDLVSLERGIIVESSSIEVLQEGVKETIMNYLQKVMTQIQNIWTKFQAKFSSDVANFLEKKVVPMLEKADDANFEIENYKDFDLNKLGNYNIPVFEYNEQNKDDYKSVEALSKKLYPDLMNKGDLKKGLESKIVTKVDKYKVGKKELVELYNFCKDGYKRAVTSISHDIDSLNNSSKNITNMVNNVISTQETVDLFNEMSLHIIREADDNEKMEFSDDKEDNTGTGSNPHPEGAKLKVTNAVTVYMTTCTKLLSAKMYMITEKFNNSIKILTHYVGYYNKIRKNVTENSIKSLTESDNKNILNLFFISANKDIKELVPRIPNNFFTKNGYENDSIPRVCFSTDIGKCLMALSMNCTDKKFYVYSPIGNYKIISPTKRQVPDVEITNEKWICEKVKLICIGEILCTGDKGEDGIPYKYGQNNEYYGELYEWNWKWIKKYNLSNISESLATKLLNSYQNWLSLL